MMKPGRLLGFLLLFPLFSIAAECEPEQSPLSVVILLPVDDEQNAVAQALYGGMVEEALENLPVESSPCELMIQPVDTSDEDLSFRALWGQVLDQEPDLLIGPLSPVHQQELAHFNSIQFPEQMIWLYPGTRKALPPVSGGQLYTFSLSWYQRLQSLMRYGWEQGQYDLALLFPETDTGRKIAETAVMEWETRGGNVVATSYYGERYNDYDRAVRQMLRQSGDQLDFVLTLSDEPRLRMIRPLMSYHSREEPVYSMMPPVGELGLKKDMEGVLYPMQPAILERSYSGFEIDDMLLEIENVGRDFVVILRKGLLNGTLQSEGYFGAAGRYSLERGELNRLPCFVENRKGKRVIKFCPESVNSVNNVDFSE